MKPVGIIANPASGKDIRRLVAYGSVFDNHEKVNIVKRVLMAMDSVGVQEVFFMPDYFGIGHRAVEDLDISLKVSFLDMKMEGTQDDSTMAAQMMAEMGVGCIITLGGDGTNRTVSKTCGESPLLPISTGTNNVFPFMVEGTLAGIAAGVISMDICPLERVANRAPRLEVHRGSELVDIALVDVVISESDFVATRAIWDVSILKEIFLARSEAGNIGFSSVGGLLCPHHSSSGKGLHIVIGPGKKRVKVPVAPGLISWLPIQSYRSLECGEEVPVSTGKSIIALDGERELIVKQGDKFTIRLSAQGPLVADMDKVMRVAAERALFVEKQPERRCSKNDLSEDLGLMVNGTK